MSRDFTPREQYLVSVKMDPSYFMLNAKIKYGPGDEEKDLYSEEEKNIIRSYPILGRSAPEFVLSVVDSCKENMAICFSLLQKMEDKLSVINTGESKCIDCFVKAWFDGELDSSFYYNKENNRLMKNYIMDEFELLKNIKTVQDWYCIAFPLDELGPKIPKTLTFDEIYEGLQNGIDIYTKLGAAADSIVRERIFEELSVRKGVDYNTVYQMWLDCDQEDLELDQAVIEQLMKKQYKATDIHWGIAKAPGETYQEVVEALGLPTEVELPNDVESNREITDYLTHKTGCYPIRFNVEKIEDKSKDEWERG